MPQNLKNTHKDNDIHFHKKNRFITQKELEENYLRIMPPLIHGLLNEEETMNIVAPPKTGKSWLALDLATAIASGKTWIGYPCSQGNVLLIENELHPETTINRVNCILDAKNIPVAHLSKQICYCHQRREEARIKNFKQTLDSIEKHEFKLIIVDSIYRIFADEMSENSADDMIDFYSIIDHYAKKLACSFVLVHSTSKGRQDYKHICDIGAGSNVISSAADTHFILRPIKNGNIMKAEGISRNFARIPTRYLKWEFPLWNISCNV